MKKKEAAGRWIATDVSEEALEVARANAEANGVVEAIDFRVGSLFEPAPESFDLICANPPYIPDGDRATLAPEVAKWEPAGALFSGVEGLDCIKPLLVGAAEHLNPGGCLLMEIGWKQAPLIRAFVEAESSLAALAPTLAFQLDHAGIERIVELRAPAR